MKTIILAAGKGTRMLPLTETIPKVLVEVNGKPFLYYVFKTLHKAGLKDLALVVGYKKEQIEAFLKEYNFKAELIEQKEQLGTGHAVLQAKEFVNNEDFIVISGDNLYPVKDIKKIKNKDDFHYIGGLEVEEWVQAIAQGARPHHRRAARSDRAIARLSQPGRTRHLGAVDQSAAFDQRRARRVDRMVLPGAIG